MKRIIAGILTVLMLCSALIVPVCAVEQASVQPRYVDIYSFWIDLEISEWGTATCSTSVKTLTQSNTFDLMMQLEQFDGTRWVTLKQWRSSYGPNADMTKYWGVSSGHYYRVFVSAAVYDQYGNPVETVGRYSGEVYH